jgi:membrane-associated phospholipid phosphatase
MLRKWPLLAWQVLLGDVRRFYSRRNLVRLGIGFLVGGILANTPLDSWMEASYRNHVHSETRTAKSVRWVTKQMGDRYVVIVAPVAALAIGALAPANPAAAVVGTWGGQFTRTFLVASPVTYGATWLLGGDRPKNGTGSQWQPWRKKQYGISGHAMAGAIPFLVMAGMSSHPATQTIFYICSGLTAWSRVDSRSHFPSQVLLGWWLSFLAMRTVRASRRDSCDGRKVARALRARALHETIAHSVTCPRDGTRGPPN